MRRIRKKPPPRESSIPVPGLSPADQILNERLSAIETRATNLLRNSPRIQPPDAPPRVPSRPEDDEKQQINDRMSAIRRNERDHELAMELHRQLNHDEGEELSPLSQITEARRRSNPVSSPLPDRPSSPDGLGEILGRLAGDAERMLPLEQLERQRSLEERLERHNSAIDFMLAMRLASENYDDDDEFGAGGPFYDSDFDEDLDVDGILGVDVDNMTYEELLELGEQIGQVKDKGLKPEEIAKLSVQTISKKADIPAVERCCICLEEFQLLEVIRPLTCSHTYHKSCIDKALGIKNECPICRRPAIKVPKAKR